MTDHIAETSEMVTSPTASDLHLIRYHTGTETPQAVAIVPSFTHSSYRELYELGYRPCSKQVYAAALAAIKATK
jgi:hypothetical protein